MGPTRHWHMRPGPRSSPISNTEDYVRVDQIAENLGIPESTPSDHLTVTKTAGLLVSCQPVHHQGPHRVPINAVDGLGSVDRAPVFQAFISRKWCVMVTRLHSREPRDHHRSSRPCRGDIPAPAVETRNRWSWKPAIRDQRSLTGSLTRQQGLLRLLRPTAILQLRRDVREFGLQLG